MSPGLLDFSTPPYPLQDNGTAEKRCISGCAGHSPTCSRHLEVGVGKEKNTGQVRGNPWKKSSGAIHQKSEIEKTPWNGNEGVG